MEGLITKLNEVSEGCKGLVKQRLKTIKVIHLNDVNQTVCKEVNGELIVLRVSTKSKLIPVANDFLVFLVQHQHLFDCAVSLLKSPDSHETISEEMTTFLQTLTVQIEKVKRVLKAKGNTLHAAYNQTVGLVTVKGYTVDKTGEYNGCINMTRNFNLVASHPVFSNDEIQAINMFIKYSEAITQALSSLTEKTNLYSQQTTNYLPLTNPPSHKDVQCPTCGTAIQAIETDNKTTSESSTLPSSRKVTETRKATVRQNKTQHTTPKTTPRGKGSVPGTAQRVRSDDPAGNAEKTRQVPGKKGTDKPKERVNEATKDKIIDPMYQQMQEEGKLKDDIIQKLQMCVTNTKSDVKRLQDELQESKDVNQKLQEEKKALERNTAKLQKDSKDSRTLQARCNELDEESRQKESTSRELHQTLNSLKQENHDLMGRNASLQSYTNTLDEEKKKLEKDIAYTEKQYGDQQAANLKLKDDIAELEIKLSDMRNRLAAEMNAKISANESSLENISIKCRPMNVMEDYSVFVSNIWLDAKQALDDKKYAEEISVRFLCEILMISSDVASNVFAEGLTLLTNPFGTKRKTKKPSDEILSAVGDSFHRQVEDIDIMPLKMKILDAIATTETQKQFPDAETILRIKKVDMYVTESALLAWKMAIQRPAMVFDQPDIGVPFQGEQVHPLAWGSKPSKKANVRYYLYPTLLHGEAVMVKGKVFVL